MNSLLKQFLLIAITIVAMTFLGCEDKTASRGGSQEKTLESEPAPIEKNIDGKPEPKAAQSTSPCFDYSAPSIRPSSAY